MKTFVICPVCSSPDTDHKKIKRLNYLFCEACGAQSSTGWIDLTNNFYAKVINAEQITMTNLCDEEQIGKKISHGDVEMEVSENYFADQLINEIKALELLENSDVLNLVGTRIIDLAVHNELASEDAVKIYNDVPFLIIYNFYAL